METPEYVGWQHIDTAGLHFQNLFLPLLPRVARIMELTHHGNHRPAVDRHVEVVHADAATRRRRAAHAQVVALDNLRHGRCSNLIDLLRRYRNRQSDKCSNKE